MISFTVLLLFQSLAGIQKSHILIRTAALTGQDNKYWFHFSLCFNLNKNQILYIQEDAS